MVDSKVGIVDYWSAKEWREFCRPSRANEAPPASQPAQHLSGSFQLNEAHARRVLRFGYLAPDIVEAIEGYFPRSLDVLADESEMVARRRAVASLAAPIDRSWPKAVDPLRLLAW